MERARTPADGIIGRRVSPLHGNTREREEGVAWRGGAAGRMLPSRAHPGGNPSAAVSTARRGDQVT